MYMEGNKGQRKRNRGGRKTIKEVCTNQKTEITKLVLWVTQRNGVRLTNCQHYSVHHTTVRS